jgi:hypothetical protein
MSIWSSIPGDDPIVYDSEDGERVESNGSFDIATTLGQKVRIIIQDNEGSAAICLTPDGLTELHRRITIARGM